MNAVGTLGRYISKGVFTVSAPFHPFGGAVDIIVVQQRDGSFKSSPWYVRFGKFQGVLKTKEKVVNVIVNGVEANLHMYLDHKGEAYFLREVDVEGDELYPSFSGDESEGKSQQGQNGIRILGSDSFTSDTTSSIVNDGIETSGDNEKIVVVSNSRRSWRFGSVWGRKSMKEDRNLNTSRVDSLERAEIAADLLEVRWSTNLSRQKNLGNKETPLFSSIDASGGKDDKKLHVDDGDSHVTSVVEGNKEDNSDNLMHDNACDSCSEQIANDSKFVSENLDLSIEVSKELSSLNARDQIVGTSIVEEKAFKGTYEVKYEISGEIKHVASNAKDAVNSMEIISDNTVSDSHISLLRDYDTYYRGTVNGEHLSDEKNNVSQDFSISSDKNVSDGGQSFMFCNTSERLTMSIDEASHLANVGRGIDDVHSLQLHRKTEVHTKEGSMVAEDFELETEKAEVPENYPHQLNPYKNCLYEGSIIAEEELLTCPGTHNQVFSSEQIPNSFTEVNSDGISSSFSSDHQDVNGGDESVTRKVFNSLNSVGNIISTEETSMVQSTSSDEEPIFFNDFDVSKTRITRSMESDIQQYSDNKDNPLEYPGGTNKDNRFVNRNYETYHSPDSHEIFNQGTTNPITIPQTHPISNKKVVHLAASLPNMQANIGSPIACKIYPLSSSVDSNIQSMQWIEFCKDNPSFNSEENLEQKMVQEQSNVEESQVSEELINLLPPAVGSPAEANVDLGGNWKPWPFNFKSSRPKKATQLAVDYNVNNDKEKPLDTKVVMEREANIIKPKMERKMVRSILPTSEELASLNLKEGRNSVTFTFSTAVLGKQQVEARIHLWKWDARIVISDVDGTITKSDVLGQFMPFVGMDWSQSGVTHLFSAIKENGYQLLFLSARAISQAYHTRQFLFNLKQDGKSLPEGPVVLSPDGLFPSLYREVIRRAPHEFKIACLERIKDLFPPDCNPFYAGFGNRDTDEISYLKVGIPKGKIFIINPKGEVVVNRRFDTKSYTSLHSLVNGMFPPTSSVEQEDFNSWNYWKLPPLIDI